MLRDPVRLDPSAVKPKIQLAQLLNAKDPAEADKLIDEAVAADPHSVEALQVNGERLRARLRCQYRRRRSVSRSEMEPISPSSSKGTPASSCCSAIRATPGNIGIGSNETFASGRGCTGSCLVTGTVESSAANTRQFDSGGRTITRRGNLRQRECPDGSEHPQLPLANFRRGDRYRADHLVRGFGQCEFRHDGQQQQRSYDVIRTETDRHLRRIQFFSLFSGRFAAIVRTEWTDR